MATSSFFYGGSTAPEQNTVDELIDALNQKVAAADEDRVAAEQAKVSAEAAASNAALSEDNVAGLAAQAQITLSQATEALETANDLIDTVDAGVATATTKAAEASASAAAAANSQVAAAGSQTAAGLSASQASSSASSASSSATAATTAKTAAEAAQAGAESAKTSAESAQTGAVAAKTASEAARDAAQASQTAAASSASSASTSAFNALTQAGVATTQANNSASSATASAGSATAAATSATNAANSASAAASSATTVANSLTNYYDKTASDGRFAPISHVHSIANVTGLQAALDSKAADSDVVKLTGDQTVAGVKTLSSNPVINAGTANGVPYLNGSKVLTSGSALTFDGNSLAVTLTSTTTPSVRLYYNGSSQYGLHSMNGNGDYVLESPALNGVTSGNLYLKGNAAMLFGAAGSEQMRLTSTGLGIGTSSPLLSAAGRGNLTVNGSSDSIVAFGNGGTNSSYIYSASNRLEFDAAGTRWMQWNTNGNERLRLDASGNLLVGKTSSSGALEGVEIGGYGLVIATRSDNISGYFNRLGSDGALVSFNRQNAQVGSISVTGSAAAYNTSSDYRLKNITGPISNSGGYIDSLNPVEGTWKADGSTFVGLIAHEVQEASRTQVATGVKDGEQMQGMDYSSAEIIANLIAEVQSLRKRLAALEGASNAA